MKITLRAQIEELEHELRMRRAVYPRQVRRRKMTSGDAELHIRRMEAALRTLLWLQALLHKHGRNGLAAAIVKEEQR